MAYLERSSLVAYSPWEMYQLVNDVASYPEFLPGCRGASAVARGPDTVEATVEFAKGPVRKSFTTLNRLEAGRAIEMSLLRGPFRELRGVWRFEPLERGTRVSLQLHFEFSNRMLEAAVGPIFHQFANRMVDAFTRRARVVYGRDWLAQRREQTGAGRA